MKDSSGSERHIQFGSRNPQDAENDNVNLHQDSVGNTAD